MFVFNLFMLLYATVFVVLLTIGMIKKNNNEVINNIVTWMLLICPIILGLGSILNMVI